MLAGPPAARRAHAAAAVFLASKADDNPRDLKLFARMLLGTGQGGPSGPSAEALRSAGDSIVAEEFRILERTGFDFEVELPFGELEAAASTLLHW